MWNWRQHDWCCGADRLGVFRVVVVEALKGGCEEGRGLRGETRYQAGWNSTMLMHSFIIESESLLIRYKVSNGNHFLYSNTTKKRLVTLFIKLLVVTLFIPTVFWTTLKKILGCTAFWEIFNLLGSGRLHCLKYGSQSWLMYQHHAQTEI